MKLDDDDVGLNVLRCQADILGTYEAYTIFMFNNINFL